MSDPTGRRGDNIIALLERMKTPELQKRGLSKGEIKTFLFRRYRFGVRDQTLESIVSQLCDRGIIYLKRVKGSLYRYFLTDADLDFSAIMLEPDEKK